MTGIYNTSITFYIFFPRFSAAFSCIFQKIKCFFFFKIICQFHSLKERHKKNPSAEMKGKVKWTTLINIIRNVAVVFNVDLKIKVAPLRVELCCKLCGLRCLFWCTVNSAGRFCAQKAETWTADHIGSTL